MNSNKLIFNILITVLIFSSCNNTVSNREFILYQINGERETFLSENELERWHLLDIESDSIPGISLIKARELMAVSKKSNEVLIAILDSKFDVNHPNIKNYIYENPDEIPENKIDDDQNGYIDDVHGWNFLGNSTGSQQLYAKFEITRIVENYADSFEGLNEIDIDSARLDVYKLYTKSKKILDKDLRISKNIIKVAPQIIEDYKGALDEIAPYYKEEELTLEILDSLRLVRKELENAISHLYSWVRIDTNLEMLNDDYLFHKNRVNYFLNIDYNDREFIGDSAHDLDDKNYGNGFISSESDFLDHGTLVSGVVTQILDKVPNLKIKILPISVSAFGDEQDKDIALAIRYAVDKGVKIINISSSKEYSMHKEWINEAVKYAESKDVLIITSSGNLDLDLEKNSNFPDDTENNYEIVSNFIKVGGASKELNENLKWNWSNYGIKQVDIFAPGADIYTTMPGNKHKFVSGTSFASPIVTTIGALIRSYYPSLKASDVKQILMDSSVKYDILVDVPTEDNPDQQLPFNELSKSGGIVNAYNALLMAEQMVKE